MSEFALGYAIDSDLVDLSPPDPPMGLIPGKLSVELVRLEPTALGLFMDRPGILLTVAVVVLIGGKDVSSPEKGVVYFLDLCFRFESGVLGVLSCV